MKKYLLYIGSILLVVIVAIIADYNFFKNNNIKFTYPWRNALFPADFTTPTFEWKTKQNNVQSWNLSINLSGKKNFISKKISDNNWTPTVGEWDSIKKYSGFKEILFILTADEHSGRRIFNHRAELAISISEDSVNAPILYREIPLPFTFAEKNSHLMRYVLCDVGNPDGPDVVLDKFRVCGNCHSFTGDGSQIALDFDASSRDKGGFFISEIDSQIVFTKEKYLSWSKMIGKNTFGMLSKISWDGKYVVTTTKDRAVSEKFDLPQKMDYSQLFFPVNGVLTIYNTETKEFKELPGANDLNYVQTNAVWTPDGKTLIFARAKALPYDSVEHKWDKIDQEIINEFVNRKRDFKFDLYSIPFNDGKGGEPVPIKGASDNGKSNYFPAISPDGKWLVFCQSDNYMMLQPDSKLFITNLETRKTRELESNFNSMNSWHAWSPNSKWIVYSSKALSMYTNLFLTHIDDKGHASVPIFIQKASTPNRALNYPEFVNRNPKEPFRMIYDFVDLYHIEYEIHIGNFSKADSLVNAYLAQAKFGTPSEYESLGIIMRSLGRIEESKKFFALQEKSSKEFYKSLVSE